MDPKHASVSRKKVVNALLYEQALARLGEIFTRKGLSPVIVKGQAIFDLSYPSNTVRQASDVDLLVGDDEDEVIETLLNAGYLEHEALGRRFSCTLLGERIFTDARHELPPVEVHRFLDKIIMHRVDYRGILARARPSSRPGLAYPSAEDLLLLTILHAACDANLQAGRTLDDLQNLVVHGRPEPAVILDRARQWKLRIAVQYWMSRLASERGVAFLSCSAGLRARLGPRLSDWLRPIVKPRGVGYFLHQLAWHDNPATVAKALARYAVLRLRDRWSV